MPGVTRAADPPALARSAYTLALRITGDEQDAAACVAAASRAAWAPGPFVRAVREEARARRPPAVVATAVTPPPDASIAAVDWQVLEPVALRGLRLNETADALGIDRREALLRLHRGLAAARSALLDGDPRDHPQAARGNGLGSDLASRRGRDAAGDRQPEAAARLAS
jgi:hypothetical protein